MLSGAEEHVLPVNRVTVGEHDALEATLFAFELRDRLLPQPDAVTGKPRREVGGEPAAIGAHDEVAAPLGWRFQRPDRPRSPFP